MILNLHQTTTIAHQLMQRTTFFMILNLHQTTTKDEEYDNIE